MTNRPTRATPDGRAYLELRRLARARQRPTDELLQLYALEGFLARLPSPPHADRFVLKGGVLLAAFDARRPTRDIDLAAKSLANDPDTIRAAIETVLRVSLDDGLEFDISATEAEIIRQDDTYSGVRVSVPCRLASAKPHFHIDVNVGDPIAPGPIKVSIPRILGGEPLEVSGYPIAMVLAEKIVTAVQRGSANTRWRDFADVATLSRQHPIPAAELSAAVRAVADHRLVSPQPLQNVLTGFATAAQANWSAWRRRTQLEDSLPQRFEELFDEFLAFADPILGPETLDATWDPTDRTWKQDT